MEPSSFDVPLSKVLECKLCCVVTINYVKRCDVELAIKVLTFKRQHQLKSRNSFHHQNKRINGTGCNASLAAAPLAAAELRSL